MFLMINFLETESPHKFFFMRIINITIIIVGLIPTLLSHQHLAEILQEYDN